MLSSMDDEHVFGPVFHRLGFGEAVEADLLADYKVMVLVVWTVPGLVDTCEVCGSR